MSLLEIKNLKKGFDGLEVLKDISLTVEKGEVLSIIGPSGSGKSTLLRCATGLETPDSGEIHYEGEFGLVFQNFNLFPHFSVLRNIIDAPVKVQKRDKKEAIETARALLKKMGLADKENAYPYQLSGGQQQRTSIGRAIVKNPDILLCDEPTGALDYHTSKEILKLLENVNQKYGNTVIMVTHNDAIKNMADRVFVLRDGEIIKSYANENKVSAKDLEW